MADASRTDSGRERLRFSPRSMVAAVGILGLTLVVLRLFASSGRVIGWLLAAATVAAFLHPIAAGLARRMPRGLAIALVAAGTLGTIALVTYNVVDDMAAEVRRLERAAPRAARDLERSDRFGDFAREIELEERTEQFVEDVPERLRGGTAQDALRSAASRGVAFLATGVLTLFFLLHGPRLLRSASEQVSDVGRRVAIQEVAVNAYRRAWRYAMGRALMASAAGLLGYLLARATDVPGASVLGLWVALWDLVPVLGLSIGAIPIVGLAAVQSGERALVVVGVIVGYQLFEALVLQRRVERTALHLGPFLTVAGGLVGVEVYGLGGALIVIVALMGLVAVSEELEDRRERLAQPEPQSRAEPEAQSRAEPEAP